MATLLADLLEDYESHDANNVFDIELQASRLVEVVRWVAHHESTRGLRVALLGTGLVELPLAQAGPRARDWLSQQLSRNPPTPVPA